MFTTHYSARVHVYLRIKKQHSPLKKFVIGTRLCMLENAEDVCCHDSANAKRKCNFGSFNIFMCVLIIIDRLP